MYACARVVVIFYISKILFSFPQLSRVHIFAVVNFYSHFVSWSSRHTCNGSISAHTCIAMLIYNATVLVCYVCARNCFLLYINVSFEHISWVSWFPFLSLFLGLASNKHSLQKHAHMQTAFYIINHFYLSFFSYIPKPNDDILGNMNTVDV